MTYLFAVNYGFMNFADIKVGTTTATTVALNLDNPYLQIVQSTTQVSTPLGANQGSTTITIRSSSTASVSTTLTLSVISPDGSEITSTTSLITVFPLARSLAFSTSSNIGFNDFNTNSTSGIVSGNPLSVTVASWHGRDNLDELAITNATTTLLFELLNEDAGLPLAEGSVTTTGTAALSIPSSSSNLQAADSYSIEEITLDYTGTFSTLAVVKVSEPNDFLTATEVTVELFPLATDLAFSTVNPQGTDEFNDGTLAVQDQTPANATVATFQANGTLAATSANTSVTMAIASVTGASVNGLSITQSTITIGSNNFLSTTAGGVTVGWTGEKSTSAQITASATGLSSTSVNVTVTPTPAERIAFSVAQVHTINPYDRSAVTTQTVSGEAFDIQMQTINDRNGEYYPTATSSNVAYAFSILNELGDQQKGLTLTINSPGVVGDRIFSVESATTSANISIVWLNSGVTVATLQVRDVNGDMQPTVATVVVRSRATKLAYSTTNVANTDTFNSGSTSVTLTSNLPQSVTVTVATFTDTGFPTATTATTTAVVNITTNDGGAFFEAGTANREDNFTANIPFTSGVTTSTVNWNLNYTGYPG